MNKFQERFKVVLFIFFFVAFIYLIQLFRIQILNDDYKFIPQIVILLGF